MDAPFVPDFSLPGAERRAGRVDGVTSGARRGAEGRRPVQYFAGRIRVLCGKYSRTLRKVRFRAPHALSRFGGAPLGALRSFFSGLLASFNVFLLSIFCASFTFAALYQGGHGRAPFPCGRPAREMAAFFAASHYRFELKRLGEW